MGKKKIITKTNNTKEYYKKNNKLSFTVSEKVLA